MLELAHKVEDMTVYWQFQKARLFRALDEGFSCLLLLWFKLCFQIIFAIGYFREPQIDTNSVSCGDWEQAGVTLQCR